MSTEKSANHVPKPYKLSFAVQPVTEFRFPMNPELAKGLANSAYRDLTPPTDMVGFPFKTMDRAVCSVSIPSILTEHLPDELTVLQTRLLDLLPSQSEEDIIQTRAQAKQLEKHGWYIQSACDAALWDRNAKAKRGRGNKDVNQTGIKAAVIKKARLIGVTPMTIYRNKQIYRLIQDFNSTNEFNVLSVLEDRGFYNAALNSEDPIQALLDFSELKKSSRRFRISDARRFLERSGSSKVVPRDAKRVKSPDSVRAAHGVVNTRRAQIEHLELAIAFIKGNLIPSCPDPDLAERLWADTLMTVEDERQELADADASDSLLGELKLGDRSEEALVNCTGLPVEMVRRLVSQLEEAGSIIRVVARDPGMRVSGTIWHNAAAALDGAFLYDQR